MTQTRSISYILSHINSPENRRSNSIVHVKRHFENDSFCVLLQKDKRDEISCYFSREMKEIDFRNENHKDSHRQQNMSNLTKLIWKYIYFLNEGRKLLSHRRILKISRSRQLWRHRSWPCRTPGISECSVKSTTRRVVASKHLTKPLVPTVLSQGNLPVKSPHSQNRRHNQAEF